ncbi:MAG: UDP-N-acetylmuramoyl-L-alanyl-D-glutamate--2,6-diaminopimelate ligase [Spirochaetaceae bacterium]|nr:UDP-N-acetylmuramoyl-L-alanyl-D-glutamate--2,6-diaminopimelate ligase [Spirochaetaceae bacterium]
MIWQLLIQLALIAVNAIFASAEIALISLNSAKLEKEAEAGDRRARRLLRLVRSPSGYLAMIQVGVTLAGFLGSAFAADSFASHAARFLQRLPLPFSERACQAIALVGVTLVFSYISMVLGELFPKRLALRKSQTLAYALSGFLLAASIIASPLVRLLSVAVNGLLRLFGIDPNAPDSTVTEEEIRLMVTEGSERGAIDKLEKQMIENVLEFDDTTCQELMTHRLDAVILWLKDSDEQWRSTIIETNFDYYPVCGETIDEVAGVLSARVYLALEEKSRETVLGKAVLEPLYVPESLKADILFRKMRAARVYWALALDEYGGFSGVITMDDLLEALAGGGDGPGAREAEAMSSVSSRNVRYRNMSIYADFLNQGMRPRSLCYDSRQVESGSLYFALPGLHVDGHQFIADAVKRGATHVVYQNELDSFIPGIHYLKVPDSRFSMSPIADEFYGSPSKKLIVIGVTGTEGKSTTVYLIFQLLRLCGEKAGFISTVQFSDDGIEQPNLEHQTTPEATLIQARLARMVENGCRFAVIEASSHGLSRRLNRLGDVAFDVGVMTRVTHEHLEFHGTWEQYRDDKANLFRALGVFSKPCTAPFGVVNADDPCAAYFSQANARPTLSFSVAGAAASLAVSRVDAHAEGNGYEAKTESGEIIRIRDCLPGAFNAGNVLAAMLVVARLLGKRFDELCPLIPQLMPVRGRMTAVRRGQDFEVLVDYAHTPSSFQAIFPPLRERVARAGGRLISVFGSAGERDTQKRPAQGAIAARYSDVVVLTDEDPRGEDGAAILEEIAQGMGQFERGKNLFLIPGRPAAIRKAFSLAQAGDIVLLLGKGHENTIIYAAGAVPYDEIGEAEKALDEQGPSL